MAHEKETKLAESSSSEMIKIKFMEFLMAAYCQGSYMTPGDIEVISDQLMKDINAFLEEYRQWWIKEIAPTDEEMAKACPQEYKPRLAAWMQGARWMRDRLQPIGKTERLKETDEEKTKGD